jgi:hypothetical protein
MSLGKRSQEGYFMLDHSQVEGFSDAFAVSHGLPPGAGKGLFEAPTYTCSHCQSVVVMNPKRNRERAYCSGCDHYICDGCGAIRAQTRQCKTMKQVIDEILTQAEKQAESSTTILLQP